MELRLGLITAYAGIDWHAARLVRALSAVGRVELLDPSSLRLVCGRAPGEKDRVHLLAGGKDARRFDAVVLGRVVGPEADADLQLDAARAFELLGVPTVNRVGPMLVAQDKLWTAALLARAGLPTPLCSSVPRPEDAHAAAEELGYAVAKPVFGSLGEGLFRADAPRARARLARASQQGAWLVQRFVPPGGEDYRLFVVGEKVEACVRRVAPPGEWRSNAARGARLVGCTARPAWRALAVAAARALALEVAGVDLALEDGRPVVLEVNGFPNFRGIYQATGRDMAPPVARRVARLAGAPPRRRAGPGSGAAMPR